MQERKTPAGRIAELFDVVLLSTWHLLRMVTDTGHTYHLWTEFVAQRLGTPYMVPGARRRLLSTIVCAGITIRLGCLVAQMTYI